MTTQERNNQWTLIACLLSVALMVSLAYAAVPLYRLFCQVTGYGGTPQTGAQIADKLDTVVYHDRVVDVRFDANVSNMMPWQFDSPAQPLAVPLGETALVFYHATNPTDESISGIASFNITPAKAAIYFNKIDCFCFEEQQLAPGQSMPMPVTFFLDPALAEDPAMHDVRDIVLSYTFFPVEDDETAAISVNGLP